MLTSKKHILMAFILTILLASSALAQQAQQTPAPSPKEPEYVEEKGFKNKVFELKHRDPNGLLTVLSPLGSGFKGARMSPNQEFKTITVRDFPENIAAIEEAIKRLDTPEAPRPDIEFRIHVLIASNAATGANEYPADLNDVIKQLQTTLTYKHYGLMTSSIHRAKEGRDQVTNKGVAESKLFNISNPTGNPIFYQYYLDNIAIDKAASGAPIVQIGRFNFNTRIPIVVSSQGQVQYEDVGIRSPVSLRSGEKVVVGTTTMGDKGLIIVLSAKVLQ